MEFHNIYSVPQSNSYLSAHYYNFLSTSDYSFLSHSAPWPSESYADPTHNENDRGVLEAITDNLTRDSSGVLDQFLTGKKRFAAKSVEEIVGLIYARDSIRYAQGRSIDYESTQLKERLFETGEWQTGLNPQLDKTRGALHRELGGLEREKRMEEVACWRDISRLKGDLREALREFDLEKRKENLLKD